MPLAALSEFGVKSIHFKVREEDENPAPGPSAPAERAQQISAFDVLMNTRNYSQLPEKKMPELTNKGRLRNALIDHMAESGVGFRPCQVSSRAEIGEVITTSLTDALWLLDPHRSKFEQRAIKLPVSLEKFSGFHDWRQQKKKDPQMKADDLKITIDSLSGVLMNAWFGNPKFQAFREDVSNLVDAFQRYYERLVDARNTTRENHESTTTVRSMTDQWQLRTIEGMPNHVLKEVYRAINDQMKSLETYEIVSLQDIQPTDRDDRRKWIENLSFAFPVVLFSSTPGNSHGNAHFLFRIPALKEDGTKLLLTQTVELIKQKLPLFTTRAMRSDFTDRYSSMPGCTPLLLRSMHRYLTGDCSAAETSQQTVIDQRMEQFLLEADDPDLIVDLRSTNGRPADPKFDPFWEELQRYLDEKTTVQERRHGDIQYMPFATSVETLRTEIAQKLPANTPIPSISWIKLNFYPSNPTLKAAMNYTGKFKVRFAVQQRLLHAQHEDAPYVAKQFKYLKEFAVRHHDVSDMICVDDKAVIPVGEPDKPVSTGVRPHHKSLVGVDQRLGALDHDFHIAGLVPSVLFHVDIPQDARDSFYSGKIHVTLKEKVFQPSSAPRHATESIGILRMVSSNDDVNLAKPILLKYSDGGPDHRTTFITVKLACLVEFVALDLDFLVCARTAPMQSWANPAERCMSVLNMGLQNSAFARDQMSEGKEQKMRSIGSMSRLRALANLQPEYKTEYLHSMENVMMIIQRRFAQLKWQSENLQIHDAASDDEIDSMMEVLSVIDPSVTGSIKDVKQHPKLSEFLDTHSQARQYTYQIKKCSTCPYCVILCPPRLDPDTFENLHFLPDPMVKDDGTYKDFDEIYGTVTDDLARPQLKSKPQPTTNDKDHKALLVGTRVRAIICCSECGKRRVIYCSHKLNQTKVNKINRVQEDMYVCGDSLLQDGIVVREGLNCESPMETTYYSGVTNTFPAVCFHCGDTEIYKGPEVQEKELHYSVVRPICETCLRSGKEIATRNAKLVGQKKKR